MALPLLLAIPGQDGPAHPLPPLGPRHGLVALAPHRHDPHPLGRLLQDPATGRPLAVCPVLARWPILLALHRQRDYPGLSVPLPERGLHPAVSRTHRHLPAAHGPLRLGPLPPRLDDRHRPELGEDGLRQCPGLAHPLPTLAP